jgi:hypothetical protein
MPLSPIVFYVTLGPHLVRGMSISLEKEIVITRNRGECNEIIIPIL